jgi:nucleoside 2-deoxyribosyltransferase
MRIYWAGGLFSLGERMFNISVASALRVAGHEVWLPQEKPQKDSRSVFLSCVEGIEWCEVVVANMDGPDPDSGTAMECGLAYRRRPIIAYRTDFRRGGDRGISAYNLMLSEAATVNMDLAYVTILDEPLPVVVKSIINACNSEAVRQALELWGGGR